MGSIAEIKKFVDALPSVRAEAYVNTPIRKCFEVVERVASSKGNLSADSCGSYVECGTAMIVDNGHCEGLQRLEQGVLFGSIAAAREQFGDIVNQYVGRQSQSGDEYTRMCEAFAENGAFLYIPDGVECGEPFTILSHYAGDDDECVFERHLVIVGRGAKAKVVFERRAEEGSGVKVAAITECFVEEDGELESAEICEMYGASALFDNYMEQGASSRLVSIDMGVSAALCRTNRRMRMTGSKAHAGMYGLFVSGANEHFDYHTSVNHDVADCQSDEHFKDLVDNGGVGVFHGLIYVAQDAQRTEAFQQNNNILLNNGAKVFTKPQLEIYADDVKCTHGATIGRPDDGAVYYMQTRGIGEQTARRLQMIGFVNDIIGRCSIECVVDKIITRITEKIDKL